MSLQAGLRQRTICLLTSTLHQKIQATKNASKNWSYTMSCTYEMKSQFILLHNVLINKIVPPQTSCKTSFI